MILSRHEDVIPREGYHFIGFIRAKAETDIVLFPLDRLTDKAQMRQIRQISTFVSGAGRLPCSWRHARQNFDHAGYYLRRSPAIDPRSSDGWT
jgi:hypothetical protein